MVSGVGFPRQRHLLPSKRVRFGHERVAGAPLRAKKGSLFWGQTQRFLESLIRSD